MNSVASRGPPDLEEQLSNTAPQFGLTSDWSLAQWIEKCAEIKAAVRGEGDTEVIQAYAAHVETLRSTFLDPEWARAVPNVYEYAEKLEKDTRDREPRYTVTHRDVRLKRNFILTSVALWTAADTVFTRILQLLKENGQYYPQRVAPFSLGEALQLADDVRRAGSPQILREVESNG